MLPDAAAEMDDPWNRDRGDARGGHPPAPLLAGQHEAGGLVAAIKETAPSGSGCWVEKGKVPRQQRRQKRRKEEKRLGLPRGFFSLSSLDGGVSNAPAAKNAREATS